MDIPEILDNIYIWVFSVNIESVLLLAFVKYTLQPVSSRLYFSYFLKAKSPFIWRKNFQNLLIFVYLFCPKTTQLVLEKHNSGMVGCRKLPDPSLNRIFNALPVGVQYTPSFQWTNFDLKCLLSQVVQKTFSILRF